MNNKILNISDIVRSCACTPRWAFLIDYITGPVEGEYTKQQMLGDNADLHDWLRDILWHQLDLQNQENVNRTLLTFLTTGQMNRDEYHVTLTLVLTATSPVDAAYQAVDIIHESYGSCFPDNNISLNITNTRIGSTEKITRELSIHNG